jgi:opacity protein-like surface antigen
MMRTRIARFAGFILTGSLLSPLALADGDWFDTGNPLNFYVGAGIGAASVHNGFLDQGSGTFRSFPDQTRFGWKVLMGIRPVPLLGAELEYLDLGSARLGSSAFVPGNPNAGEFLGASTTARAGAGFLMGYLPLASSKMDVFGKVGVARLQMPYRYTDAVPQACPPGSSAETCSPFMQAFFSQHGVDTGPAYGGGAQVHIDAFAVRAEYERINTGIGDPYLLSVGFTWTP